jgi:hypothetical protein
LGHGLAIMFVSGKGGGGVLGFSPVASLSMFLLVFSFCYSRLHILTLGRGCCGRSFSIFGNPLFGHIVFCGTIGIWDWGEVSLEDLEANSFPSLEHSFCGLFLFIQFSMFAGFTDSMFDEEVLLQTCVGVEVIPGLKGWYSPVLLPIEVYVLSEQVTGLDPTLDLVRHGSISWVGFIPCKDNLEGFLKFVKVVGGDHTIGSQTQVSCYSAGADPYAPSLRQSFAIVPIMWMFSSYSGSIELYHHVNTAPLKTFYVL